MELVLKINRMNPAEYFASLGFLELLSQQDPDLLSHFAGEGVLVDFCATSAKDISLPDLRTFPVVALPHEEAGIASVRFGDMQLDWWLDIYKEDKSVLKNWGGTTTAAAMLQNYKSLLSGKFTADALHYEAETKTKSCFNFDTRASRSALQAGYSRNDAKEAASLYPWSELLCAIGLQNFRPTRVGKKVQYYTWHKAIATSIAHAACKHEIPGLHSEGFEINFAKVGQLKEVSRVVSLQLQNAAVV